MSEIKVGDRFKPPMGVDFIDLAIPRGILTIAESGLIEFMVVGVFGDCVLGESTIGDTEIIIKAADIAPHIIRPERKITIPESVLAEPMREPPPIGTKYWAVLAGGIVQYEYGASIDKTYIELGIAYDAEWKAIERWKWEHKHFGMGE
jgi:hypothetical protein